MSGKPETTRLLQLEALRQMPPDVPLRKALELVDWATAVGREHGELSGIEPFVEADDDEQ